MLSGWIRSLPSCVKTPGYFCRCPNGAATRSPGLPLRLPWVWRQYRTIPNRNAVASFASENPQSRRNRVAVGNYFLLSPCPGLPKRQPWAVGRSPVGAPAKVSRSFHTVAIARGSVRLWIGNPTGTIHAHDSCWAENGRSPPATKHEVRRISSACSRTCSFLTRSRFVASCRRFFQPSQLKLTRK